MIQVMLFSKNRNKRLKKLFHTLYFSKNIVPSFAEKLSGLN